MGGKSKHFLKEEAVPTIFNFAREPARKRRESSISHASKRAKMLCIEEAISSHEAMSIRKTCKSSNLLQKRAFARSL